MNDPQINAHEIHYSHGLGKNSKNNGQIFNLPSFSCKKSHRYLKISLKFTPNRNIYNGQ